MINFINNGSVVEGDPFLISPLLLIVLTTSSP